MATDPASILIAVSINNHDQPASITPEQFDLSRKRALRFALAWGPAPAYDLLLVPVAESVSLGRTVGAPRRLTHPGKWAKTKRNRIRRAKRRAIQHQGGPSDG